MRKRIIMYEGLSWRIDGELEVPEKLGNDVKVELASS